MEVALKWPGTHDFVPRSYINVFFFLKTDIIICTLVCTLYRDVAVNEVTLCEVFKQL